MRARTVPAAEAALRSSKPAGGACGTSSPSVATVVMDEPTWTALDPERRTLCDVDEPTDMNR